MLGNAKTLVALLGLGGCSGVPAYDLLAGGPPESPAGPKVAAVIANLKCELFRAMNDDEYIIPVYYNDPSLPQRFSPGNPGSTPMKSGYETTLQHLFQEIEFVGEVELDLDVTSTTGTSPSLNFIEPLAPASTNYTLSVSGGLSDAGHRRVTLYMSIDGERLVYSPPYNGKDIEGPVARFAPTDTDHLHDTSEPSSPCGLGADLGGNLGLGENMNYYFQSASMNDLSVWPTGLGPTKIQASDMKYGFDQMQIVVDFTVSSTLNGGPAWTLSHFKGPTGASGLFGYSRSVKDTLTMTLLPICIRQKYETTSKEAPYRYQPELVEGTPRWSNFLPPCSSPTVRKGQAVTNAHISNLTSSRGLPPSE